MNQVPVLNRSLSSSFSVLDHKSSTTHTTLVVHYRSKSVDQEEDQVGSYGNDWNLSVFNHTIFIDLDQHDPLQLFGCVSIEQVPKSSV